MKIRNGFVSNSSSSSYIVFIPDDFEIKNYDYTDEDYHGNIIDKNRIDKLVKSLKNGHGLWSGDYHEEYDIIVDELEEQGLIVYSIDTGPDDGSISIIGKEKIEEIYNKFIKE